MRIALLFFYLPPIFVSIGHCFWWDESDHYTNLNLGIIFDHTSYIVHLQSLDTWLEKHDTSVAASPLTNIPIHGSAIEISLAGHI
jgi:hypothetical protein